MQFNFPNQTFEIDNFKGAGKPTNRFITININKINTLNVEPSDESVSNNTFLSKRIRVWHDESFTPKAIAASKELNMDSFNYFAFVDFGNQIKASNNKDISQCFSLDLDKDQERDRPYKNFVSNFETRLPNAKLYIFRSNQRIIINFDADITYNR